MQAHETVHTGLLELPMESLEADSEPAWKIACLVSFVAVDHMNLSYKPWLFV